MGDVAARGDFVGSALVAGAKKLPAARLGSRLRAGTALMLLCASFAGPALAGGGVGGGVSFGPAGGAGGIDNLGTAGGDGAPGDAGTGLGGGGGGAGSGTGGAGGAGGPDAFNTGGNGGAGGVHGQVGPGLPTSNVVGSNGGAGGNGSYGGAGSPAAGGGGGGAGGYGAVTTGTNAAGVLYTNITGGNGGKGGDGIGLGRGGDGGSGGVGLYIDAGAAITVQSTIKGGNGGAGGANGGTAGAGGEGVVGANITIANFGTISGGLSGDGTTRAAAVHFTGGNNRFIFIGASVGLVGGIIVDTGAVLTFNQSINVTIANDISGGGTIVNYSSATVTLTGNNTYSGGTRFAQGTLSVSSNANLGASSGGLTFDGGTLQVTGSFSMARPVDLVSSGTIEVPAALSLAMGGTISGAGSLTKTGGGTLVLTGENSHGGGTTISAGTLQIGDGGTTGAITGDITNNATLVFNRSDSSTYAGAITGSGNLVKDGSGTLILTGNSSYGGGTTISAGALQIGDGGTTGAITGDVTNNATIVFNRSDSSTYGGVISGSGNLVKDGAGILVLTGANSYIGTTTVSAGILRAGQASTFSAGSAFTIASGATLDLAGFDQTIGSLAGAGAVTLGAGTLTAGGDNAWTTFSGTISGTGGLTKTGTGTLRLSGSSTYSGATTVSAGTLYIDRSQAMSAASDYTVAAGASLNINDTLGTVTAGSIAGAGQIRIEQGSTLETGATNASTTFTGMIYDAGSIRKAGTGTLTLTQENTYSGGTTIAGGAVSISKESNLGATSGALTLDGGVLQVTGTTLNGLARNIILGSKGGGFEIVEAGNSFIVSQSLSGTGSLSKTGAGTLVLKGTSSYSGTTTVSEGTLRAGAANAFSANSTFTVASGTTLDLAGLNQTIGSLAGAGTVTLGSGTLTAGANNSSTSFSGTITGTGGVTKTGTGTLTLTGSNTYTGSTKVSSGKLVVNGALASSVTLDGGTLGGSGTIAGVSVASGGTVAPGNSIGTLSVSGNVAFASGSTYQVEVNAAGQSDRIVASGNATLSGGTVQVLAENGNYAAATSYTILTASGGVSGTFSSVSSNLAFLTPSLAYDSQSVTLTMTRNDTSFGPDGGDGTGGGTSGSGGTGGGGSSSGNTGGGSGSGGGISDGGSTGGDSGTGTNTGGSGGQRPYIAATRNQGFIAVAAERLGVGNPVYDALISATVAEARAGFDLLSGEAHAQGVSVMIDESRLVRDTILGHLRGPLLTQAPDQVAASFSADLPGRKGGVVMPAPLPQPRYALWGTAFGSTGNTDADGNAASLNRRSGGALLGADLMLYDAPGSSLKVGVAGGYSQSRFDLDARLSTGRLESGHAALYAGARFGNLRLDAGAAYSWSESDIRRQVQIRGFGDLLRLQRPGSVTQGFAELGYAFAFSGVALEPFAQLALIRVSTDAGTERGGAAALRVLSSEQTLGFSTLGLRAEAQIGAMPLFARAMLGWRHGFGELTSQARTAFVAGTTPATVSAARIDREALVAEAGLDWRISQATAIGLTYSAAIGERSSDHALKGRVEMRF